MKQRRACVTLLRIVVLSLLISLVLSQNGRAEEKKEKMLFFIRAEMVENPPLPSEKILELVKEQLEYFIRLEKEGKSLAGGSIAGGKGGLGIFAVQSVDEIHQIISNLPLFPFVRIEIVPLVSSEENLKLVRQQLERIKEIKPLPKPEKK